MDLVDLENKILSAKGHAFDKDAMAWAWVRRVDYPLTHYDHEHFEHARQEGDVEARLTSDPAAAMSWISESYPQSALNIRMEKGLAKIDISISEFPIGVSGEFTGALKFHEIGLGVAVAALRADFGARRLAKRLRAVEGIEQSLADMRTWPIEEITPGKFHPVNHQLRLMSHGAFSAESATQMISMNHKGVHGIMLCRERYEAHFPPQTELDNPSP